MDAYFESLRQPPVSVDPGEEALDDPASCDDREADLLVGLAHGLDTDWAGVGDPRPSFVTILDRCRMGLHLERPVIGIDHRVTRAALDLLARVAATDAAAFNRLDILAIDHRCGRACLAAHSLAVKPHQVERLDTTFADRKFGFIKIGVEGAEIDLLSSGRSILRMA